MLRGAKTAIALFGFILSIPSMGWSAGNTAGPMNLSAYDPTSLVFVTNRDSNDVSVVDTQTDRVLGSIPLGNFSNAHMAMLTGDGKKLLVSATGKDRFLIVDLATQNVERSIETGSSPEHFDITTDNRLAYIGNMKDSTVSVVDLIEGRETVRMTGFSGPHGVSVLPNQGKVYVSNLGAPEVTVLGSPLEQTAEKHLAIGDVHHAAGREPQPYLASLEGISHPTLTPDGKFIYAADGDAGEVTVIDTQSDRITNRIQVGKAPWRAYASPDGAYMLVLNNGDKTVSVIETTKRTVVATLQAGAQMTGVNFTQGGRKAYVISRGDSTVYVFDMKTLKQIRRLKIGANVALETAATTADGRKLYLASSTDNALYVIDSFSDQIRRIADIGRYPWGVTILGSASPGYCH